VCFNYSSIYKIKIHEVTLRELLIMQSFYLTNTITEIIELIKMQPNPSFFYKTFLELDVSNMVSILAFDSASMESLLGEANESYFSEEFPIIYKNKVQKRNGRDHFFTTAIDYALKNNQVKAVDLMVKYIVRYQNNYVSSFLFLKNLPHLIERGISILNLLESKIFVVTFDYDGWPSGSTYGEEVIRGYHGSFFNLRYSYRDVFPEDYFDDAQEAKGRVKVAKIKFQINLLPSIGMHIQDNKQVNEDISLTGLAADSDELEIFHTDALQHIITFKWDLYGRKHHLLGCATHFFYVLMIILFIKQVYINESEKKAYRFIALALGITYPALYDWAQLFKGGLLD
jgi:hypothetical protein